MNKSIIQQVPHFYVHYYGWNDLPLNKAVADMFSIQCPPSLFEIADHLVSADTDAISSSNGQKKRVGFISSLIGGDEPHGLLVLDIIGLQKAQGCLNSMLLVLVQSHYRRSFMSTQAEFILSALMNFKLELFSSL